MSFYIQYDSSTGQIDATVQTDKVITGLPENKGQIVLDDAIDVLGKKVDITQNPPVLIDDDLHE